MSEDLNKENFQEFQGLPLGMEIKGNPNITFEESYQLNSEGAWGGPTMVKSYGQETTCQDMNIVSQESLAKEGFLNCSSSAVIGMNCFSEPARTSGEKIFWNKFNSMPLNIKSNNLVNENMPLNIKCSFPLYEVSGIKEKPLLTQLYGCERVQTKRKNRTAFVQKPLDNNCCEEKLTNLESINIDSKFINASTDIYNSSPLLRIHYLFYKVHVFLNDTVPTRFTNPVYYEYEDDFRPGRFMMKTNSLQTHLRQIVHKSNIFILGLENKLNANKLLDRKLYEECQVSVKKLNSLISQLDRLRNFNFEYNSTKFLNINSTNRGRHLELLLEDICESIREANIFVHVFSWAMENKRKELKLTHLTEYDRFYKNTKNIKPIPPDQSSTNDFDSKCNIPDNLLSATEAIENEKYDQEYKKIFKLKQYFEKIELENNIEKKNNKNIESYAKNFNDQVSDEEN